MSKNEKEYEPVICEFGKNVYVDNITNNEFVYEEDVYTHDRSAGISCCRQAGAHRGVHMHATQRARRATHMCCGRRCLLAVWLKCYCHW